MLLLQELIKIPNAIFPFHKAEIACIVFETIITIMKKIFSIPNPSSQWIFRKKKKKNRNLMDKQARYRPRNIFFHYGIIWIKKCGALRGTILKNRINLLIMPTQATGHKILDSKTYSRILRKSGNKKWWVLKETDNW